MAIATMPTMTAAKLALFGGKPVGAVRPPQFPRFTDRAIARVTHLLANGKTVGLNKMNPEIREAESAISRYHGGLHCLGTSSGHAALQMSLAGLEIGPGDEVVTTPYTWGASISCILHQGAIPVFADVDRLSGLLDPGSVERAITGRTRAILVVHIFGQPADMTRIMKIARERGVAVIEDGSQAHGATWKGQVVGNFADAAGFSCMGGKLLATSEAGYMVTPHEDVYWRACLLSQHMGRSGDEGFPEAYRPYVDSLVYTYRLNAITAVLLTEQIKKLDREIAHRRQNVALLRTYLRDSRYLRFPDYGRHARPSYHILTMNFDSEQAGVRRDTFQKALRAEGLNIGNYVPSPIPTWKRLHWKRYRGPRAPWLEGLRRAGVDYSRTRVPNCRYKVDHALDMGFNFYRPAKAVMQRIAATILKVEDNIDLLRRHERETKA